MGENKSPARLPFIEELPGVRLRQIGVTAAIHDGVPFVVEGAAGCVEVQRLGEDALGLECSGVCYRVGLRSTPSGWGRGYLRMSCPECGRDNCATLVFDGARCACVACFGNRHKGTHERPRTRRARQREQLRWELGLKPGQLAADAVCPPGLHAGSFKTRVARLQRLEDIHHAELVKKYARKAGLSLPWADCEGVQCAHGQGA